MEVLIGDAVNDGVLYLNENGVPDAKNDAYLLAERAFNISRAEYYANPGRKAKNRDLLTYQKFLERRAKREPLQYILGTVEFMGMNFNVQKGVLIPRQDTETLVEKAVLYIENSPKELSVLDMCTGSGCIAVSIEKMCHCGSVDAVDVSKEALDIAKENSKKNNSSVRFICSNLWEDVEGKYDLVVSNPPYIKRKDIGNLMSEVKDYEPVISLDGGEDGLDFYRRITRGALCHMSDNGTIMYEIGYNQADQVADILMEYGFYDIEVTKDLSGNNRVISAKRSRNV